MMDVVVDRSYNLVDTLSDTQDNLEINREIVEYLTKCENVLSEVIPDFEDGWEWFNTECPLFFRDNLKGKIIVLDFFTYCCVNCLHILPDLKTLEQDFTTEDGVIIIGVHSAKFSNEKVSANIRCAIQRYNITHPVVNDAEARLWHLLGVQCWPTLVVVGPQGQMLLSLAGETHTQLLHQFVSAAVQFYSDRQQLVKGGGLTSSLRPTQKLQSASALLYPGKVSVSHSGDRIAVADTGHHRVLLLHLDGTVQDCIGGPQEGFQDGTWEEVKFRSPQGLCWSSTGDFIYVADTNNHTIRKVHLRTRTVVTVAGTGVQGHDLEGGRSGREQPINSPWDVALGKSAGSSCEDVLFIAMAGCHQIWLFFLHDTKWIKGKDYVAGTCVAFAGSGREENRNNNYPHKAGFAQPSGVAVGLDTAGLPHLYVADSESSTIRSVSLTDGAVRAVIGGERDPTNLFAYGDVDGCGVEAKLQHPLGVSVKEPGVILVADSYNHKIKVVTVDKKECSTLLGDGDAPCGSLSEPGGIYIHPNGRWLYIADTNNHCLKVYDCDTALISQLVIHVDEPDHSVKHSATSSIKDVTHKTHRITPDSTPITIQQPVETPAGGDIELQLVFTFNDNVQLTEGAPSEWQILLDEDAPDLLGLPEDRRGGLDSSTSLVPVHLHVPASCTHTRMRVRLECMLYYCDDAGTCRMQAVLLEQPIVVTGGEVDDQKSIIQRLEIYVGHSLH